MAGFLLIKRTHSLHAEPAGLGPGETLMANAVAQQQFHPDAAFGAIHGKLQLHPANNPTGISSLLLTAIA
jgi:hypothetical protein